MSGTVTDRRALARNRKTFQDNRAWDKAIESLKQFAPWSMFDEHHIPETSSEQRMHHLVRDCWCQPELQRVPLQLGVAVLHKAEQ